MKVLLSILVVLAIGFGEVASQRVHCEAIEVINFEGNANTRTCSLKGSTDIQNENRVLAYSELSIVVLWVFNNKKIRFLPTKPDEAFPYLVYYHASHCSIEALSKDNFVGLSRLRILYLDNNRLTRINSGTFEDLESLQTLTLFSNQITQMNGGALDGLSALNDFSLDGNPCINRGFKGNQIARLPQRLSRECGFVEEVVEDLPTQLKKCTKETSSLNSELLTANSTIKTQATVIKKLNQINTDMEVQCQTKETECRNEISTLKNALASAQSEILQCKTKDIESKAEISELKAQLNDARLQCQAAATVKPEICPPAATNQLETEILLLAEKLKSSEEAKIHQQNQISMMSQFHKLLEGQWNATCTEKMRDCSETVVSKATEIHGLLEQQATDRVSMKEKDEEIALLKNRLVNIQGNQ